MARLPPLNTLVAFEATARLGSMSAAGHELSVTHGAISKQIRLLEDWLGVRLFERRPSGLVTTRPGALYFDAIAEGLGTIAAASSRLSAKPRVQSLRINAPPAFTARWLLPRLPAYRTRSRDTEISVDTSNAPLAACLRSSDVVIRRGPPRWPTLAFGLFLDEFITPVCHPTLVKRGEDGIVDMLSRSVWLYTDARGGDWQTWLARVGYADLRPPNSLHFDHSSLTIDAAARGMGVGMVPLAMVQDELHSSALIAPFPRYVVQTPGYYVISASERVNDGRVASFCNWLREEGLRAGSHVIPNANRPSSSRTKGGRSPSGT